MRKEKRKNEKGALISASIVLALILISINFVLADTNPYTQESSPAYYQNLPVNNYLYPNADFDPWSQKSWKDDYCNNTGMDFLIQIMPTDCSPAVVRSDLLEEQDVPVLCRMTGIKINPVIQVPYIKSITPVVEGKTGSFDITYLPARVALSYYAPNDKVRAGSEGVPTMSNLGYLQIMLKQQPSEAKMPDNVKANISVRIKYDVAKTYGIAENQFILPLLTDNEWQSRYKEFSFWHGRGYLRLLSLTGSVAKVAVYTNPKGAPLRTIELREGVTPTKMDQIMLLGFYCAAGVNLKLESIEMPVNRARFSVNGNELILKENDNILDSDCKVTKINPLSYYGGYVTITCPSTSPKTIELKEHEAVIDVKDSKLNVNVGDSITTKENDKNKYFYVGYLGKEYAKGVLTDYAIFFNKEDFSVIKSDDINKIAEKLQGYVKIQGSSKVSEKSDKEIIDELKNIFKGDSYAAKVQFFVGKVGISNSKNDITLISVTGPEQVFYSKEIEDAYKDAIDEWEKVAFAYAVKEHPEGSYYGIIALHNAANLAGDLHKKLDQAKILGDLIDKYSSDENPDVVKEVDNAREELRRVVSVSGANTVSVSRPTGNYLIELVTINKPGLKSQEAQFELNNTIKETLTIDDMIDDWTIIEIAEDKVTLKNLTNQEIVINVGEFKYLDVTKAKLVSTTLRKDVKVSVLPFEPSRETITNFTVQIGIEKRAIKLSPEKTKEMINKLDKTITSFEKVRDNLGKIVTVWKKACFIGAGSLWIKNFFTGLGGEAYARKLVMQPWSVKCSDISYRQSINAQSISDCYRINENNINKDIDLMKGSIANANKFINDIKSQPQVTSKSGILGLGTSINDEKFMEQAEKNFPSDLKGKTIYEQKQLSKIDESDGQILFRDSQVPYNSIKDLQKRGDWNSIKNEYASIVNNKVSSDELSVSFVKLYDDSRLFTSDVKEITLQLELYKDCQGKQTALCQQVISGTYGKLAGYSTALDDMNKISEFQKTFSVNPVILRQKNMQTIKSPIYTVTDSVYSKIKDYGKYPKITKGERYIAFSSSSVDYIAVVVPVGTGGRQFTIKRLYEVNSQGVVNNYYDNDKTVDKSNEELSKKLNILQISDVEEIDTALCNKNEMKSPKKNEVNFWESGSYQGLVAFMPINVKDGWYLATIGYSGLEGAMVAWKENADINTFWICNVGQDGVVNFDNSKGPEGDDCCTQVTAVTGAEYEIAGCIKGECDSKPLIDKAKSCAANAIREYAAGKRTIDTKGCGKFNLGKPATNVPAAQCEDYMSPSDCRIMFNLCDPVMCPASRCDMGGRYPTDNVIGSGIVGSLVLCLPNYENGHGVMVPICLTGVHAGLDSFIGIMKSGRDCLNEQLKSGKTVGICDQIMSVYMCEFFWKQFDPFIKAGIPAITESLTNRGGGEYALFSESWKQSVDAARYFTDFYGVQSVKAFKARSTGQIGTEVCKRYASVAYPTQAKFWDELSKPESPTQATACFQEIPMGGASPNSQYKVYSYIFAGNDQGVYYSIFLRSPSKPGYYAQFVPEEYLVKGGYGYLPAGQYLSISPDFTAPSGYKEIVMRINDKEISGFADCASTSFAINEVQNYYLQNQLKQEVKTSKECVSGTPTLFPTATLNIQQYAENALEPQIYRRGILRICSSRNPGESIGEKERYNQIGYCDSKSVGCWLDMNSVNESISDLGIRSDVITQSNLKDIDYNLAKFNLNDPKLTQTALDNLAPEMLDVKTKVNNFIKEINTLTLEEITKEKITDIETRVKSIDEKDIQPLMKKLNDIDDTAARSDEKARAEYSIAQLYDLRARLYAQLEVHKFEKNQEKDESKTQGLGLPPSKQQTTSENKLTVFPVDPNYVRASQAGSCYGTTRVAIIPQFHDFIVIDAEVKGSNKVPIKAIAGGKIISLEMNSDRCYLKSSNRNTQEIIIQHSNSLYSYYCGEFTNVVSQGNVNEGDVIAWGPSSTTLSTSRTLAFAIYDSNPITDTKLKAKNPFCYFSSNIRNTLAAKKICQDNIEECLKYENAALVSIPTDFKWPVEGYGTVIAYWKDRNGEHEGIDIEANEGKNVYAIYDGQVVYVDNSCGCKTGSNSEQQCGGKYGNYVVIQHDMSNGKKVYALYAHLDSVNVKVDEKVTKQTAIGIIGNTGNACSNANIKYQLHLETHVYSTTIPTSERGNPSKGTQRDPLCFFSTSDLKTAGVLDNKFNAKTCDALRQELGITQTQQIPPTGKIDCSTYGTPDSCNTDANKGKCWWDSYSSNNGKKDSCTECPDKCEGKKVGFLDLGNPEIRFKTVDDCEQNNCNLNCECKDKGDAVLGGIYECKKCVMVGLKEINTALNDFKRIMLHNGDLLTEPLPKSTETTELTNKKIQLKDILSRIVDLQESYNIPDNNPPISDWKKRLNARIDSINEMLYPAIFQKYQDFVAGDAETIKGSREELNCANFAVKLLVHFASNYCGSNSNFKVTLYNTNNNPVVFNNINPTSTELDRITAENLATNDQNTVKVTEKTALDTQGNVNKADRLEVEKNIETWSKGTMIFYYWDKTWTQASGNLRFWDTVVYLRYTLGNVKLKDDTLLTVYRYNFMKGNLHDGKKVPVEERVLLDYNIFDTSTVTSSSFTETPAAAKIENDWYNYYFSDHYADLVSVRQWNFANVIECTPK